MFIGAYSMFICEADVILAFRPSDSSLQSGWLNDSSGFPLLT